MKLEKKDPKDAIIEWQEQHIVNMKCQLEDQWDEIAKLKRELYVCNGGKLRKPSKLSTKHIGRPPKPRLKNNLIIYNGKQCKIPKRAKKEINIMKAIMDLSIGKPRKDLVFLWKEVYSKADAYNVMQYGDKEKQHVRSAVISLKNRLIDADIGVFVDWCVETVELHY